MKIKLWQQIFIGMVLGVIVGIALGDGNITNNLMKPIGTVFINLIKMLVVPLIFFSLIVGITSIGDDLGKMGRIGGKTFCIYLITTAIAVTIGLIIATIFSPGVGLDITVPDIGSTKATNPGSLLDTFMNTIVGVIPTNPIASLSSGNILQIILFTLLFGIAISLTGEKAAPVKNFIASAAEVTYTLTGLIMKVAPIGVFALMAWVAGKYGLSVLMPLIKLIFVAYLASFLHVILTIGTSVKVFGKYSPLKFFKAVLEPFSFAFVSTSSSGTLPFSLTAVQKNLGVSKRVSNFVLPLGATINMDGTAIYQGVAAVFIAQAYGIDLTSSQYLTIIFTSTLASIGAAGIPGAGLIMLSMVLSSAGLPLDGIAMIAGVDRILDMARTSVNVLGDCMVSLVIGRTEGEVSEEIDESKFV